MVSVSYKFVLAVILIAVPFVLGCLSFALGITATIWCPALWAFISIVVACAGEMLYLLSIFRM